MNEPLTSHSVEVVPPGETVAVAVEVEVPLVVAVPDVDADADAEPLPLAVAVAEEELVVKNWKACASPPLNVKASKRQGNAKLCTDLIMATLLLKTVPFFSPG